MTRTIITTANSPQPNAPLSQAVRSGNLLFVSGITPFTLDLQVAKDDFDAQMRQTMKNLGAVLEAAGSGFHRVLKCTVILARRDDWPRMNLIYAEFWPDAVSRPERRMAPLFLTRIFWLKSSASRNATDVRLLFDRGRLIGGNLAMQLVQRRARSRLTASHL